MRAAALSPAILLAFSNFAAPAATAGEPLREEASSTVEVRSEPEGVVAHSVNRSFRTVSLHPPGEIAARTLLLREEVEVIRSTVEEGPRRASVRVAASLIGPADGHRPLWRIEEAGEEGALVEIGAGQPYYQVTRHGCCGARDSISTWSLASGRRLFTATGPAAYFDVPNSRGLMRLAAVHAAWSVDDERAFGGRQDVAAAIVYASPTGPLRRILVTIRPPATVEDMMGEPRAMLLPDGADEPAPSATLWSADGRRDSAAIAGISLVVAFTPGNTVTIPIVADDLDLEGATVPPTLALEKAPLQDPMPCSCRPPRRLFPAAADTAAE